MAVSVVVDTNVIVYLLLRTEPFRAECDEFWQAASGAGAPEHWAAEFSNAIWRAVQAGLITAASADVRLVAAERLQITSVRTADLWHGALARSASTGLAVYDTLFVELAEQSGCPLVTFDAAVLRAYPGVARRPRELS